MNKKELLNQIEKIEKERSLLPEGSITTKRINGKEYYYHRITKDKKRKETYVDFNSVDKLKKQIEKRKILDSQLKQLRKQISSIELTTTSTYLFSTYVIIGNQLNKLTNLVKKYKKRECYQQLYNYVFNNEQEKVFVLYGLRRTGKTTLIRQIFLDMAKEKLDKTAYIQIKPTDTLSDLNSDLKYLEANGYKYIFIDEITLMEDFIEGAALFSDIYAAVGMKIILSGTDSLGFVFTKHEQLYDRCILLHTTFIPYREFENVLGIKGIDEYIRYGGTMSMSGINYNQNSTFATIESTNEYINSSIAHNIQHSLKYYQSGTHFRSLFELYEKKELTNVINRIVEDINHRFTIDVLTKTFKSNDLAISNRNLLHDRNHPIDLYNSIDLDNVNNCIKDMLEILNIENQSIKLEDEHRYQIKEYLAYLDLIVDIDLQYLPNTNRKDKFTILSQPGMRYAQAEALINSLLLDEKFNRLSIKDRTSICNRILSEIKGRMMEEIVLLETKMMYPKKQVFKLQFAVGEFDMVVFDPNDLSCEIYEIKYSKEIVSNQVKHLSDEEKCASVEHRFGTIKNKYVIYRGETTLLNNIHYVNVEEYLKFE